MSTPPFKADYWWGVAELFAPPMLEYFDIRNVTFRVGDIRKLRGD
ncbi:SelB C-terminal domain-containing protein [uncultured Desulfobacter sp.]|nr:SelB C-terminal domain-containing protein [uncultured Desulfobacter sp.]